MNNTVKDILESRGYLNCYMPAESVNDFKKQLELLYNILEAQDKIIDAQLEVLFTTIEQQDKLIADLSDRVSELEMQLYIK